MFRRVHFLCVLIIPFMQNSHTIQHKDGLEKIESLRDCFVLYNDRDQPDALRPYAVVKDALYATEDTCLSTCLHDTQCKGVMYGFVGGHQVIACELYDSPQIVQLIYAPYSNVFILKSSKCKYPYEAIKPLDVYRGDEVGDESTKRKIRYRKANKKKRRTTPHRST